MTVHTLSSSTDLYRHSPICLNVSVLNYTQLTNALCLHLNYIMHTILTSSCPNIAASIGGGGEIHGKIILKIFGVPENKRKISQR